MDMFHFRTLVRSVLGPGHQADCEALILSYEYALATPEQQVACVAEVQRDVSELPEPGGE